MTRWRACASSSTPRSSVSRWRRSEEHTSELQSQSNLVCRLLLEKKKTNNNKVVSYLIHNTLSKQSTKFNIDQCSNIVSTPKLTRIVIHFLLNCIECQCIRIAHL